MSSSSGQHASLNKLAEQSNVQWRAAGLERNASVFNGPQTPVANISPAGISPAVLHHAVGSPSGTEPAEFYLFSSSNYLGLAEHPDVKSAAHAAIDQFGIGSGGSRLTTGSTHEHTELERELARFFGTPDAVFFTTGYQANLSSITVLAQLAAGDSPANSFATNPGLTIFSDELNHASIIDGCRMATRVSSSASLKVFPHRDYAALDAQLAARTTDRALIVTDGVFSMDGDLADLPKLQQFAHNHDAWLMVDDAHGVGTLGATGRGIAEHFGTVLPDILVGTASKALGVEGGFVLTSAALAQLLRNRARSYVFSTAAPAIVPAAIRAALPLVPHHVGALQTNAQLLRRLLFDEGVLATAAGDGPIIVVPVGEEKTAMAIAVQLRERGFFIPAIRYPTVKRGAAILRLTVMATHTEPQLKQLAQTLAGLLAKFSSLGMVGGTEPRKEHES